MSDGISLKKKDSFIDNNKVKILYEKYDLNKNGIIDKNEFIRVMTVILKEFEPEADKNRLKEVVEEGLQTFDLNENGKLEYDEFFEFIHFLVTEKGFEL